MICVGLLPDRGQHLVGHILAVLVVVKDFEGGREDQGGVSLGEFVEGPVVAGGDPVHQLGFGAAIVWSVHGGSHRSGFENLRDESLSINTI
jgi:hypothetical protein